METVPNAELRLEAIPTPDAPWGDLWAFAGTFNAYEYWGSFDKCAEIANNEQGGNLTELRTCLFFECRRWHHFGDDPDEEAGAYIRGVVAKIRRMVAEGKRG